MLIYILTGAVWVIAFAFPLISILSTHNGADHGGFYTRAGAWVGLVLLGHVRAHFRTDWWKQCWVNPEYTVYSLWLEYFWIFVAMAVTVCLLTWVLFSLQRNKQSARHFPQVICDSMELRSVARDKVHTKKNEMKQAGLGILKSPRGLVLLGDVGPSSSVGRALVA